MPVSAADHIRAVGYLSEAENLHKTGGRFIGGKPWGKIAELVALAEELEPGISATSKTATALQRARPRTNGATGNGTTTTPTPGTTGTTGLAQRTSTPTLETITRLLGDIGLQLGGVGQQVSAEGAQQRQQATARTAEKKPDYTIWILLGGGVVVLLLLLKK